MGIEKETVTSFRLGLSLICYLFLYLLNPPPFYRIYTWYTFNSLDLYYRFLKLLSHPRSAYTT